MKKKTISKTFTLACPTAAKRTELKKLVKKLVVDTNLTQFDYLIELLKKQPVRSTCDREGM